MITIQKCKMKMACLQVIDKLKKKKKCPMSCERKEEVGEGLDTGFGGNWCTIMK